MIDRDQDSQTRARRKQRIQEICNKLEELRSQIHTDGNQGPSAVELKTEQLKQKLKNELLGPNTNGEVKIKSGEMNSTQDLKTDFFHCNPNKILTLKHRGHRHLSLI
jgi:Zn-dependent M16 (insulinase) family peptidase